MAEDNVQTTKVTDQMRNTAVKQQLVERVGKGPLRITAGHRDAIATKRSAASSVRRTRESR
ncbi:MAG: hypothetical protein JJE52_12645 [Acidimicrobiia bacterium]|nr:hypothetical protein [Acidimicrobiia bacterium]